MIVNCLHYLVGAASYEESSQTAGGSDGSHCVSVQPLQGGGGGQSPPRMSHPDCQPHPPGHGELP